MALLSSRQSRRLDYGISGQCCSIYGFQLQFSRDSSVIQANLNFGSVDLQDWVCGDDKVNINMAYCLSP